MAELIKNIAIMVFIISVVLLTLLAVLAIWDVFDNDILYKSLSTIGVITFASIIVIIAAKVIEGHSHDDVPPAPLGPGMGV